MGKGSEGDAEGDIGGRDGGVWGGGGCYFFWMRKVNPSGLVAVWRMMCPAILANAGMSFWESGSVAKTRRICPGVKSARAFLVRKTGRGQRSPERLMSA